MKGYKSCEVCLGTNNIQAIKRIEPPTIRPQYSGTEDYTDRLVNTECPQCIRKRLRGKIKKLKREVKRINIMYDEDMGIAND